MKWSEETGLDKWFKAFTLYQGKAKDMNRQTITAAWLKNTKPIEQQDSVNFSRN